MWFRNYLAYREIAQIAYPTVKINPAEGCKSKSDIYGKIGSHPSRIQKMYEIIGVADNKMIEIVKSILVVTNSTNLIMTLRETFSI